MKLQKYIEELNVLAKLRAFAVSTKHLGSTDKKESDYFLLILEIDNSKIKIKSFPSEKLEEATKSYEKYENEFKNSKERDVVLVSAGSVQKLKKAYPNYFADTTEFHKYIVDPEISTST